MSKDSPFNSKCQQQFFNPVTSLNCKPFPSTEWANPRVRGVGKKGREVYHGQSERGA